jgi:hypothetical protein
VPEFIDPVFTKTSPKRSFSLNRKRAFWLVFAKTGSIISGTGLLFRDGVHIVMCPVFLTNLEGKVGKVGKVGRVGKVGKVVTVGKEGRLRE